MHKIHLKTDFMHRRAEWPDDALRAAESDGTGADDAFRVCQPCRQTSGVHPPLANSACFPYGENRPQTIAIGRRKLGTPLAVAMGQTSKCSTVFSPHHRLCAHGSLEAEAMAPVDKP